MGSVFDLTADEKKKKFFLELKDLLAGAAFPFMIMAVFSVTIISFAATTELVLAIVILCIGEAALAAAYVLFGRQNGITAMRKTYQNAKKRDIGSKDKSAFLKVGEYALFKGIIIAVISCVPYIVIQLIECIAHNSFCDFLLQYAFGWAVYPFRMAGLSDWLNFIWIIPLCALHTAAYVWGGSIERKRMEKISQVEEIRAGKK